jgi:hypothetical protein
LQNIKAKKPESKWSSFRAALASVWKESQIDALSKRLDAYRSQMTIELQFLQK